MTLVNGSMIIQSGTTMVIQGPVTWTLAPGATLQNNGTVDLGTEARLVEPAGGPVSGIGIERSELPLGAGATDLEPGGLGLTLSLPPAVGGLVVTRGHVPRNAGGQVESIARWYGLDAPTLLDIPFNVTFRYDPTELNGLAAEVLSMHTATDPGGPWADLPTVLDIPALTLTAGLEGSGHYITAFDPDQTTALSSIAPTGPFLVWPTAASHVVHVQPLLPVRSMRIELLDATGKLLNIVQDGSFSSGTFTMDISTLPAGCYLLRINALYVQRFVKS